MAASSYTMSLPAKTNQEKYDLWYRMTADQYDTQVQIWVVRLSVGEHTASFPGTVENTARHFPLSPHVYCHISGPVQYAFQIILNGLPAEFVLTILYLFAQHDIVGMLPGMLYTTV